MTNFDKDFIIEAGKTLASFVIALLMLLAACVMCSCRSTRYVPVETVRTEFVEADTTAVLSHFQRFLEAQKEKELHSDSVVDHTQEKIVLNEQGDTVRIYNTRYIYKSTSNDREWELKAAWYDSMENVLRSRMQLERKDSVPKIVEIKESSKQKEGSSWWKRLLEGLGGGCLIMTALTLLYIWKKPEDKK